MGTGDPKDQPLLKKQSQSSLLFGGSKGNCKHFDPFQTSFPSFVSTSSYFPPEVSGLPGLIGSPTESNLRLETKKKESRKWVVGPGELNRGIYLEVQGQPFIHGRFNWMMMSAKSLNRKWFINPSIYKWLAGWPWRGKGIPV